MGGISLNGDDSTSHSSVEVSSSQFVFPTSSSFLCCYSRSFPSINPSTLTQNFIKCLKSAFTVQSFMFGHLCAFSWRSIKYLDITKVSFVWIKLYFLFLSFWSLVLLFCLNDLVMQLITTGISKNCSAPMEAWEMNSLDTYH